MDFSWMAWTGPTALFFLTIAGLILAMCVWEYFAPGGNPRRGVLGLDTSRGDRLFVSLLGSAWIALAWLALVPLALWWSLVACVLYSVLVFRYC
jgi:predicted small integral membrane protein